MSPPDQLHYGTNHSTRSDRQLPALEDHVQSPLQLQIQLELLVLSHRCTIAQVFLQCLMENHQSSETDLQSPSRLQIELDPGTVPSVVKTRKTEFFALQNLPSPTGHLSALRGRQDNPLLLQDGFLSLVLHNVPDTCDRYLQSQVRYSLDHH